MYRVYNKSTLHLVNLFNNPKLELYILNCKISALQLLFFLLLFIIFLLLWGDFQVISFCDPCEYCTVYENCGQVHTHNYTVAVLGEP